MPAHPTRHYVGALLLATFALASGPGLHVNAAGADEATHSALDLVRASVARRAAAELFDVEAMSQRMLARHWNEGSPSQQAEFIRLLTSLLERALSDAIMSEAGASSIFDGQSIDGPYAQVRSRVLVERRPDIPIEYRLSKTGERWLVYDVLRDGASLVSGYRDQFSAILRTSSFAELLGRMRGNETQGRSAAEDSEDVIRRLMLFRVVAGRRGLQ
jgi:phospholipid transport system substrate-binding protein